LIACGVGLLLGSDQALVATLVPYLQDMGFDLQTAALLVALQSGSAIAGKVGLGLMADRVALQRLFAVVAVAHLVLLSALIINPGYWTLLSILIAAGLAIGGVFPLLTMLIAAAFGSRSYGTAYGVMNTFLQIFAIGAVYFTHHAYDRTGTYQDAFWVFGGFVFVSIFLVSLVRLPRDAP